MLVKETLKTAIEAAFVSQMNRTENREAAVSDLADKLAAAIDAFVRSAQVNPGIPVATAGTAAAQTGATTGTGTIS